jgi:DNA-binding response OmpR family regulator
MNHDAEVLMKKTILLLESDSELRKVIALHMERLNWRVLQSKTMDFALQLLEMETPDILILEMDTPYRMNGVLIDRFRDLDHDPSGKVVILALEHLNREVVERYRPDLLIYKPFDIRNLSQRVKALVEESTK